MKTSVLLLLTVVTWISGVQAKSLRFKHMANYGDTEFLPHCDDCFKEVNVSNSFKVFKHGYTKVYVGSNGYLTVKEGYIENEPIRDMAFTGPIMMAPLWSDIYMTSDVDRSHIWYREETEDQGQLKKARKIIQAEFATCGGVDFEPTALFIATWSRVASYCDYWGDYYYYPYRYDYDLGIWYKKRATAGDGSHGDSPPLPPTKADNDLTSAIENGKSYHELALNSFQAVLATDGCQTYAIFNMHTIEWDECLGYNKMMFNDGNGEAFYNNTENDLVGNSNVGTDGRWVYKISGQHVVGPDCGQLGS